MHTRLKEERERLGLSQVALGEICGAGRTTVVAWESGKTAPDLAQTAVLAANGMDVLYILTGERHENVARGSVELSVLQRFRVLEVPQRFAVVKLLAALCGQDKPPKNWESH